MSIVLNETNENETQLIISIYSIYKSMCGLVIRNYFCVSKLPGIIVAKQCFEVDFLKLLTLQNL